MAHEDVAGEVGRHAPHVGYALHLLAQGEHVGAVFGEVQVGAADAARLHLHEHLPELGLGIGDVVAYDHLARSQHRSPHVSFLPRRARG